jgi:hypothetical protein
MQGIVLLGRAGSVVTGTARCVLGALPIANALRWKVTIAPCDVGESPSGLGGYSCALCPTFT